jgi:hypothetical protein
VHRSLRPLTADLAIRASAARATVDAVTQARAAGRASNVRRELLHIEQETDALLAAPLEDPTTSHLHFQTYVALSDKLSLIEQVELPFLARFSDADAQQTALCDALLDQVGWIYERPLVGTFSSDYYWTLPARAVICCPVGEERRLLGIADLCHELGHTVIDQDRTALMGDFMTVLFAYVRRSIINPPPTLRRPAHEFFEDVLDSWRQWFHEFACDLVAVYLVGPAFCWQHLRLAAMNERAKSLFEPLVGEIHPADDARFNVAAAGLRQIGFEADAATLASHWHGLTTALAQQPRPEYEHVYPDELVEAIAERVTAGCRALGLRAYDPTANPDADVAVLTNRAWVELRAHPRDYEEWEREALDSARAAWARRP